MCAHDRTHATHHINTRVSGRVEGDDPLVGAMVAQLFLQEAQDGRLLFRCQPARGLPSARATVHLLWSSEFVFVALAGGSQYMGGIVVAGDAGAQCRRVVVGDGNALQ